MDYQDTNIDLAKYSFLIPFSKTWKNQIEKHEMTDKSFICKSQILSADFITKWAYKFVLKLCEFSLTQKITNKP